jgi:hypothetical protein
LRGACDYTPIGWTASGSRWYVLPYLSSEYVLIVAQRTDVDIGPSFAKYMLDNVHLHGLSKDEMAFLVATFYGAGSETVRCLLFSCPKICG